ncbi:MAG: AEC family transporter [Sulfitobacter sp.]
MNLTLTVLEIVAPVFILVAVGFFWVKLDFEYRINFVTQLAMSLAIPCLIFTALMQANIDPAALTALTLASIAAYLAVAGVAVGLVWAAGLHQRTYLAPMIFGNTGNVGLPLALFAFGPEGLSYAVVVFAVMAIWTFTFGIWLVAGAGSFGKVLREPLVWATLLGGLFLWRGWHTPSVLTTSLEMIGQMAIPLMLITLGVAVARLTPKGIGSAIILSLIKLILCTGIAWLISWAFDLNHIASGVLILQIATPVAVTSYLLAEKYGADSQAVAGLVVVSTLMSVGTLPLLLAFVL